MNQDIAQLLKIAQKYDDEGRTDEARQLDGLAIRLAAEIEKEEKEEKEARSMSGKAKAKFRAVKKACEALCKADLDYRGEHKKECRKVETLCEDILEALKDCEFGD